MMVTVGKKHPTFAQSISIVIATPSAMTSKLLFDHGVFFQHAIHIRPIIMAAESDSASRSSEWRRATTGCHEIHFGGFFAPPRCTAQCCSFGCCNEFHCEGTIDTVKKWIYIYMCVFCFFCGSYLLQICLFYFLGLVETRISACRYIRLLNGKLPWHFWATRQLDLGRLR